jgi:hypothetical protein
MPVIPATWEVEVGRSRSETSSGKKTRPYLKSKKSPSSRVTASQVPGPEFKPQYLQKKNPKPKTKLQNGKQNRKILKVTWTVLTTAPQPTPGSFGSSRKSYLQTSLSWLPVLVHSGYFKKTP